MFFCIPILKTFDDNIIVSRYCLKLFVNNICSYCINDALRKTICASGAPMAITFFFDSNNFFISVSSVQQIFMSIFVGKFILPRSQKYFSGILYTDFESICTANLSSLSSILSSVLLIASSLLQLLESFFARFLINVLTLHQNTYILLVG